MNKNRALLWDWIALAAAILVILSTVVITGGMQAPVTWWRMLLLVIPVAIVLFGTGWVQAKVEHYKYELQGRDDDGS